jgi:hypothetical protein
MVTTIVLVSWALYSVADHDNPPQLTVWLKVCAWATPGMAMTAAEATRGMRYLRFMPTPSASRRRAMCDTSRSARM